VLGGEAMEMGMPVSERQPPDVPTVKSKITQSEIKGVFRFLSVKILKKFLLFRVLNEVYL
jgi:hypothetical protein